MTSEEAYYRQLLERYLKNEVSADEARELFAFSKEKPELADQLLEESGGEEFQAYIRQVAKGDDAAKQRILERLEYSLAGAPVRELGTSRTRWWWAAAAILLMTLGAGLAIIRSRTPKQEHAQNGAVNKDGVILPGGNRAVLTLSDGATVILDSVHTGQLAKQAGAAIIKTDSGQLAYRSLPGKPLELAWNTLRTPRGGQYHLQLEDGTDVWLNAASSIRYPARFAADKREVMIDGEAWFDVAKDKSRPFLVKSANMAVEVLGTQFNINAYADEGATRTTLLNGSIRVAGPENGHAGFLLKPGQQAIAGKEGSPVTILQHPDLDQVLAWKNGLFQFDQADLPAVLRQIGRWYDIPVRYGTMVPAGHFKGRLQRNLTLNQIIEVLTEMGIRARIQDHTLIIE